MATVKANAAMIGDAHKMYSSPNIFLMTKNKTMSREPLCNNDKRNGFTLCPTA